MLTLSLHMHTYTHNKNKIKKRNESRSETIWEEKMYKSQGSGYKTGKEVSTNKSQYICTETCHNKPIIFINICKLKGKRFIYVHVTDAVEKQNYPIKISDILIYHIYT